MKIDVVTIFPEFFTTPLATSMVARAVDKKLVEIALHDLRDFATDRHRSVDAAPFGGGGGMVLKPEPVAAALETDDLRRGHCVYLTADGVPLDQDLATGLSLVSHLVLLCGHYKGLDERVKQISCGEKHTVALTESGKVYTTGAGDFGLLGRGNNSDTLDFELVEYFEEVRDSVLQQEKLGKQVPCVITQVKAGKNFTAALTEAGEKETYQY